MKIKNFIDPEKIPLEKKEREFYDSKFTLGVNYGFNQCKAIYDELLSQEMFDIEKIKNDLMYDFSYQVNSNITAYQDGITKFAKAIASSLDKIVNGTLAHKSRHWIEGLLKKRLILIVETTLQNFVPLL